MKKGRGYKVMRIEDGKLISAADYSLSFPAEIGTVIEMPYPGIFLGYDEDYVIQEYSKIFEKEVLLTLEFDQGKATQQTLNEFTVPSAKVIEIKILDPRQLMTYGGIVKGKKHHECDITGCGETYQVTSTGKYLELESDEIVLCPQAMMSLEVFTLYGTTKDIINYLNKYYQPAYVEDQPLIKLHGGEGIVNIYSAFDDRKFRVHGTPNQIASCLNEIDNNGYNFRDECSECSIAFKKGGIAWIEARQEKILSEISRVHGDRAFLMRELESMGFNPEVDRVSPNRWESGSQFVYRPNFLDPRYRIGSIVPVAWNGEEKAVADIYNAEVFDPHPAQAAEKIAAEISHKFPGYNVEVMNLSDDSVLIVVDTRG